MQSRVEVFLKDEVEISGFKDIYHFFMSAKARKRSFYVSFGDAVDQTRQAGERLSWAALERHMTT